MKKITNIAIIAIVVIAAAAVVVLKQSEKPTQNARNANEASAPAEPSDTQKEQLPKLVDLGASKCTPCKMMEPILEELKDEYSDSFKVEFIDVWENEEAGEKYNIRMIPTQIFFDAEGKEIFRHEGFFSKEDILATWEEHDIDVQKNDNPQ